MRIKEWCSRLLLSLVTFLVASTANAGFDVYGPVQRVQVDGGGNLWFAMDTTQASTFCKPGWNALTMYVPKDHSSYPYYFSILMTAATKGTRIYVANISVFDGTGPCDITRTGFGLVYQP